MYARLMRPLLLSVLLASVTVAALTSSADDAAARATVKTVRYGYGTVEDGRKPLAMDVYRPSSRAKRPWPVVVLVHGGAFVEGTRTDPNIVRIARGLAARGILAASIDYRVRPDGPVPSARVAPLTAAMAKIGLGAAIVAAVDDTLTAVDYVKAHARTLGVDAKRLALIGSSAGGITVDQVAYALDDYGIAGPEVRFVGGLWGGFLVPNPAAGEPPANMLAAGDPPLFTVHGDQDTTVPVQLDDDLVARARAVGVPVTYGRVAGGTHGYDGTQFFTRAAFGRQTAFERLLDLTARRLR
jgi:acetyl esterase/lipase